MYIRVLPCNMRYNTLIEQRIEEEGDEYGVV